MAPGSDHYATLDVRPSVNGAGLRQAYHKLMRLHHPDVNGSAESAERCKAINEAYACLRDPRRRALYDARRRAHQRARRAAFSPTAHSYRPTGWNPTNVDAVDLGEGLDDRRSRILRVVGAVLLTVATFWATTWIELPGPTNAKGAPAETETPSRL